MIKLLITNYDIIGLSFWIFSFICLISGEVESIVDIIIVVIEACILLWVTALIIRPSEIKLVAHLNTATTCITELHPWIGLLLLLLGSVVASCACAVIILINVLLLWWCLVLLLCITLIIIMSIAYVWIIEVLLLIVLILYTRVMSLDASSIVGALRIVPNTVLPHYLLCHWLYIWVVSTILLHSIILIMILWLWLCIKMLVLLLLLLIVLRMFQPIIYYRIIRLPLLLL